MPAAALVGGTDLGLQAVSDARDAVRMETVIRQTAAASA